MSTVVVSKLQPSFTIRETVKVPEVVKMCVGLKVVDVLASPKSQLYVLAPVENCVKLTVKGTQPDVTLVLKNAFTWLGNTVISWYDVSVPHSLVTTSMMV